MSMNKIIATPIEAKDLVFGDVYALEDQETIDRYQSNLVFGIAVYVKANGKLSRKPKKGEGVQLYKLTFVEQSA